MKCFQSQNTTLHCFVRCFGISVAFTLVAHAVFAVTIPTVPVGNPGNPADMRYASFFHPNGVGSVGHAYRIGKTEITNAQYVEFLNAVAATDSFGGSDPTLYNPSMGSTSWGGITRSGSAGSYTYAVKSAAVGRGPGGSNYTYHNKPVVYVSFFDAMRFTNWLHNGQGSGDTESGVYNISEGLSETRSTNAKYWIPSQDEWFKAAYHKNDGATGNYWSSPTGTDDTPNNNLPTSDTGNSANFANSSFTTGSFSYPLTDAGAYTLSSSPYGTFDQGGNVSEWNEAVVTISFRGQRGGAWSSSNFDLPGFYDGVFPTHESNSVGFRVASAIPEPATSWILGFAIASGFCFRRRAASIS